MEVNQLCRSERWPPASYYSPQDHRTTCATDRDAPTHVPLNYEGLQLPGCSFSPEFPELVGCTLDPPTQARCWGVSPGWMTALRRDKKHNRRYDRAKRHIPAETPKESYIFSHTTGRLVTFFFRIHKEGVLVFNFAVCIQKMEFPF